MINILLLEDDELFALTLIDYLEEEGGFNITHVNDGSKFHTATYSDKFDIYLLDINVPVINGLELLSELRFSGDNTPAIYITSYKDKQTLTTGFENGADDFLTKSFDMDELVLRISSIMRRIDKQSIIKLDDVEINFETKTVKKDSTEVKLGLKTLELLELFHQNNNKIVSKDMIIHKLWNIDEEYSEGSIRVYVNNIKKLFSSDDIFKITNLKNVGYKIEY